MKWYLQALRHYADFTGRARRKEFWMFALFNYIFLFIAAILDNVFNIDFKIQGLSLGYGFMYVTYALAAFLPNLSVCVRRLHDRGKSGWLMLFYPSFLIFFVIHAVYDPLSKNPAIVAPMAITACGMIWLFILLCKKGNTGENEYGPDPKDTDYNHLIINDMNPTRPDQQNPNQYNGTIPNSGPENYNVPKKTMIGGQDEAPATENPKSKYVLAGFLVSFSKIETGEFWDLREGNNAIGSAAENNIQLAEEHVSGKHANINVSRDTANNKWKFQLVDLSSSNGTELNGIKLSIYTGVEINNFDKIKIGEYQFVLFATDKFTHGLKKSESFVSTEEVQDYDSMDYSGGDSHTTKYNS